MSAAGLEYALETYGAGTLVFAPWADVPRDYRSVIDGRRYTLAMGPGGTTLTPWFGPDVLAPDTGHACCRSAIGPVCWHRRPDYPHDHDLPDVPRPADETEVTK